MTSLFHLLSFKIGPNVAQAQQYYEDGEIDSKYNIYESTAEDHGNYNDHYKSQFESSYEPEHYEPEHYEPEHYEPEHYGPEHYEPEHYDQNIMNQNIMNQNTNLIVKKTITFSLN